MTTNNETSMTTIKADIEEHTVHEEFDMDSFLKEIEREIEDMEVTDEEEESGSTDDGPQADVGDGQEDEKAAKAWDAGSPGGSVLSELVGPDKKFKTVEDLAIGKKNADAFIEQLIAEKRAIEKELERERATRLKLEDLLQEVRNMNKRETNMDMNDTDKTPLIDREMLETNPNEPTGEAEAIEKLVEAVLQRKEQEARKVSAWGKLMADMSSRYGDKAQEVLQNRLKELNISEATFEQLVIENPEAAEALVLGTGQAHGGGDISPIGDSRGFSLDKKPGDMTLEDAIRHGAPKSFWDSYKAKLKKEHGRAWSRYWLDRRVQKAILVSAQKLGERFFQ